MLFANSWLEWVDESDWVYDGGSYFIWIGCLPGCVEIEIINDDFCLSDCCVLDGLAVCSALNRLMDEYLQMGL